MMIFRARNLDRTNYFWYFDCFLQYFLAEFYLVLLQKFADSIDVENILYSLTKVLYVIFCTRDSDMHQIPIFFNVSFNSKPISRDSVPVIPVLRILA
jgi:hypothetical protein